MDIIKISLIVFVAVVAINCLPVFDKSITVVIGIATTATVMWIILNTVLPVITGIKDMFSNELSGDISIVYKSLGISLITQFVSDVASDSGNKSLSNLMNFSGKLAILVLAIPVYIQVLEIIKQLLK